MAFAAPESNGKSERTEALYREHDAAVAAPSVRSLLLRARTRLRSRLGDVAAGLGGAQWVQTLLRRGGGGGDGGDGGGH